MLYKVLALHTLTVFLFIFISPIHMQIKKPKTQYDPFKTKMAFISFIDVEFTGFKLLKRPESELCFLARTRMFSDNLLHLTMLVIL